MRDELQLGESPNVPKQDDRLEQSALIASIAKIPHTADSIIEALEQSIEALCGNSSIVIGRAQVHSDRPGQQDRASSEYWYSSLPDRRSDPVRRAGDSEPPLSADRGGDTGVHHMRLAGATVDPVEGAARKAGMLSVVYLDIRAEGKPAATLQLFADRSLTEFDDLLPVFGLLISQLEQFAGRDRMRNAVRAAA